MEHGQVQVLTSNATHAYMPLMVTDESIRTDVSRHAHERKAAGAQEPGDVAARMRLPPRRAALEAGRPLG